MALLYPLPLLHRTFLLNVYPTKQNYPLVVQLMLLATTCIGAHIFHHLSSNSNSYLSEFSAEKKIVPTKSKALIDTQISIAVPQGCYGRVAPRSGLGMFIHDL